MTPAQAALILVLAQTPEGRRLLMRFGFFDVFNRLQRDLTVWLEECNACRPGSGS